MRAVLHSATTALAPVAIIAATLSGAGVARGEEQSVIKTPGDHPRYALEAEPHALLGFGSTYRGHLGVGVRGTFVLMHNGFVPEINNSVGLGIGFDVVPYRGEVVYAIPFVIQWNFWMTTHWSLFGEPGIGTDSELRAYPIFSAGARYHFSEKVALTMRVGYPSLAVGVSLFP